MSSTTKEHADPNLPEFPYYMCEKCRFLHHKGKECTGKPGKRRFTYDTSHALYILAKIEWYEAKPKVKKGFEDTIQELEQDIVDYVHREKVGGSVIEGKKLEARDEVLGGRAGELDEVIKLLEKERLARGT